MGLVGLGGCSDDEPGNEIVVGQNVVRYNATDYPVDIGLLNDFEDAGGHYNIDFSVTNGVYIPFQLYIGDYPVTYWTARDATIEGVCRVIRPARELRFAACFSYRHFHLLCCYGGRRHQ